MAKHPYVVRFTELGSQDVGLVGGKNASLGEMITNLRETGINVPPGFATTAATYWALLDHNRIREKIAEKLKALEDGRVSLAATGRAIRDMMLKAEMPPAISEAIAQAYRDLGAHENRRDLPVAVRSSATAEDLPEASFAGQQESYLNIVGEEELLDACRRCFASLFTDRAISYRTEHGFDHMKVALSVGVQKMVRAGSACAGVMFSLDTETGFREVVRIDAAWGLGETVVKGLVDPDQYMLFKPLLGEGRYRPIIEKSLSTKQRKLVYAEKGKEPTRLVDTSEAERASFVLTDEDIIRLGRWAAEIERHYGRPMDMEWAKDADNGDLFIVQARPETVRSRKVSGSLKSYRIKEKGRQLASGLSVGDAIATGRVCKLASAAAIDKFADGSVLVAGMTDPDWVPIMRRAAAVVTDHGGRTSHAAIVSRELGLPAVVGTGNATELLKDDQEVTVSCAEGDTGFVYEGAADFEIQEIDTASIPATRTQVMLNLANPAAAFRWWQLPADGVGLVRIEFIIGNLIKIHPMALVRFEQIEDKDLRARIEGLTQAYPTKADYFVDQLARGIARIAAAYFPKPVIVRTSDFKSNEYAALIGGRLFEPEEQNPMLGWRGASRYYSDDYREGFALECRAIRHVREEIGLVNVAIMIPFCRTVEEADRVLDVLAENGLVRGRQGLEVYVMCEVPSNVVLADQFATRFDGFSIGSNDLTQLVLGVDRDSEALSPLFNEENEAVTRLIAQLIATAHERNRKVGLCGQAPSDHPEFSAFLVEYGIDSLSVSPDSFLAVTRRVAEAERRGNGFAGRQNGSAATSS